MVQEVYFSERRDAPMFIREGVLLSAGDDVKKRRNGVYRVAVGNRTYTEVRG